MGDNAVRWGLQQTQFSPTAQLILIRICKHLDDRRQIWSWKKKLDVIAAECNTSRDSLNRYCDELEGRDREGAPIPHLTPALFRGFNKGRPTEYIILGPNKTATDAYISEVYPPQVAATNPPQVAATLPTANRGDSGGDPPQVAAHPPQVAATHQDSNSFSSSSPVRDSNIQLGKTQLQEIWKTAIQKIRREVNKQTCFTWFDPAVPLDFRDGRLWLSVPNDVFVEYFADREKSRKVLVDAYCAAGLPVREITFVARDKVKTKAARASPG